MVTPFRHLILLAAIFGTGLLATAAQKRPNILFCIADDWGWPHAGAYGSELVETPTFDRIAREGVLFTNAFTSNPKCAPCRASITTGRNSWQLEEGISHWNRWPEQFVTFPDLLAEVGYHVGMTGKGWGPGDYEHAREHNLADSAEHTAVMAELHLRLMAMLKAEGDPRLNGRAEFFDAIEYLGRKTYSWDVWHESQ